MDPAAYSAIPTAIWSYYELLKRNSAHPLSAHPLVEAVKSQGEDRTWQCINELFRITAKNTKLRPDKLLRDLGFDKNNLDNNHLQSLLGVMRAINMLHGLGFTNIKPLRATKSRRESDLIAEYKRTRFAVEVFRSSEATYRFPGHNNPVHDLERYIAKRYNEKRPQLEATRETHKCGKALLVVVMDSSPANRLTGNDEWPGIVKNAYCEMGSPSDTHLFLFTGLRDSETGTDEHAAYPELVCLRNG